MCCADPSKLHLYKMRSNMSLSRNRIDSGEVKLPTKKDLKCSNWYVCSIISFVERAHKARSVISARFVYEYSPNVEPTIPLAGEPVQTLSFGNNPLLWCQVELTLFHLDFSSEILRIHVATELCRCLHRLLVINRLTPNSIFHG